MPALSSESSCPSPNPMGNVTYVYGHQFQQLLIERRQGGGFVKGRFWRTCPRSGFRSRRTCEPTLVPVFVRGEHPNVPSFRLSFRENICQNHPFGKPPFWKTTLLRTSDLNGRLFETTKFAAMFTSALWFCQRAKKRALDPWSLDLRLGRPRFCPKSLRNP